MELDLCLALPFNNAINIKKKTSCKRGYGEVFDEIIPVKERFSLKQPNDEDEDGNKPVKYHSLNQGESEEENSVVGWPPINAWRRKLHHQFKFQGAYVDDNHDLVQNRYVKVGMEGVCVGRKIDLSVHYSYETLRSTLFRMFEKYMEGPIIPQPHAYVVTYQDRQGDWLLLGDVPWPIFIESVHRLKIQRKRMVASIPSNFA